MEAIRKIAAIHENIVIIIMAKPIFYRFTNNYLAFENSAYSFEDLPFMSNPIANFIGNINNIGKNIKYGLTPHNILLELYNFEKKNI